MPRSEISFAIGSSMERVAYNSTALTAEVRRRAEVELNEFEATRDEKIDQMKVLLRGKKLKLPDDDDFFLQFLRARKFDVSKAAKLCKNYFRLHKTEIYQSIDYSSFLIKLKEYKKFGVLPYRDPSGCPVLFFSVGSWDPNKIAVKEFIQSIYIVYTFVSTSPVTQIVGFKVIVDFGGVTLRQVLAVNPKHLWSVFEKMENALPGRYKEIHILNQSLPFDYLWAILKPFMKEKLRSRFFLHGSSFEELHKRIPPEILPAECGGCLGEYDNTYFAKDTANIKKHFENMNQYGYQGDSST